jgi:hypothetical protein
MCQGCFSRFRFAYRFDLWFSGDGTGSCFANQWERGACREMLLLRLRRGPCDRYQIEEDEKEEEIASDRRIEEKDCANQSQKNKKAVSSRRKTRCSVALVGWIGRIEMAKKEMVHYVGGVSAPLVAPSLTGSGGLWQLIRFFIPNSLKLAKDAVIDSKGH